MMRSSPFLLIVSYVCMTYAEPSNCKRRECAKYTVIDDTNDKYEIRRYQRHNIITHSATVLSYRRGMYSNFMPLFRYIRKNNDKREKIAMTIPVFNGVEMKTVGGKRDRTNKYKMTFFLPSEVTNPPAPMDNNVKMGTFGPVTAYVKTFSGWAREDRVFKYQEELRKALIADNVQINDNMFYVAEFNSPWQFWNRHNELIYLAA